MPDLKSRIAYDMDGNIVLSEDNELPGHTVDALVAAGNIEGAKAELERLILEGLDSGDPVEMTPEKWRELRIELHRQAGIE